MERIVFDLFLKHLYTVYFFSQVSSKKTKEKQKNYTHNLNHDEFWGNLHYSMVCNIMQILCVLDDTCLKSMSIIHLSTKATKSEILSKNLGLIICIYSFADHKV